MQKLYTCTSVNTCSCLRYMYTETKALTVAVIATFCYPDSIVIIICACYVLLRIRSVHTNCWYSSHQWLWHQEQHGPDQTQPWNLSPTQCTAGQTNSQGTLETVCNAKGTCVSSEL